ncbi:MAG TPA: c-type cytochrome [Gaiellaceae bacterium]|nr:c-type cytochrome [Gaiellaceae bacterium]
MNRRQEERRAQHKRYKEDVQERGKPFFPYAMFHDTMMSLLVVSMIVALAVIWKFTAEESPAENASGWLGKLYDDKADPGTTSFIPRPDWYFYFLFYLLRIFKWPESVVLGTVGIPTIALILLIAFPFLDVSRERRPTRRPVAMVAAVLTVLSMGVLTYKGATARESLGSELIGKRDEWAKKQGFEGNQQALEGARIFAVAGCANCHTYLGAGTSNAGAPDLSEIGSSGRNLEGFVSYISDPSQFGNNVMPKYEQLGEENLRAVATFLAASKGGQ